MSKLCMIKREERRIKLTKKYFVKRKNLRIIMGDINASISAKELAQKKTSRVSKRFY